MSSKTVSLDVREDIRRGHEPFSKIMQTVSALGPDDNFRLIAPFEPTPLYAMLSTRGWTPRANMIASGDWEILFSRTREPVAVPPASKQAIDRTVLAASDIIEVDARGLEPPGPLVKILEAVESLPPGAQIRAYTERRPLHLYPRLEERGFLGETSENADGTYVTHIRRR